MWVSVVYSAAVLVISPGLNIDCPQAIGISGKNYWLKSGYWESKCIGEGIVKCRC
jgi:hypothetical protein